jgi:hypothetical protein
MLALVNVRTTIETNTAQLAEKKANRMRYNFHGTRCQLWYLELLPHTKTQENRHRKAQEIPGRVTIWVAERGQGEMPVPGL